VKKQYDGNEKKMEEWKGKEKIKIKEKSKKIKSKY
jgi:hypothetical protein